MQYYIPRQKKGQITDICFFLLLELSSHLNYISREKWLWWIKNEIKTCKSFPKFDPNDNCFCQGFFFFGGWGAGVAIYIHPSLEHTNSPSTMLLQEEDVPFELEFIGTSASRIKKNC